MDNTRKMNQDELKAKIVQGFGVLWNIRWTGLTRGYEVNSSYSVLPSSFATIFLIPGDKGWKISDGGMMEKGDYFNDVFEGDLTDIKFNPKNKKIKYLQEDLGINYKNGEYFTDFCDDIMLTRYMLDLIEFITNSINSIYLDYLVRKRNEEKKN